MTGEGGGENAIEVDTRGTFCPAPLIEASEAARRSAEGVTMSILADDPGAPADFVDWCKANGHLLVGIEKDGRDYKITVLVGGKRPL